jgi:hypothetical protein
MCGLHPNVPWCCALVVHVLSPYIKIAIAKIKMCTFLVVILATTSRNARRKFLDNTLALTLKLVSP